MGATGRTVAENVKRVRTAVGITQTQLSERLAELDRPIPTASIGKIEKGLRAVEVDDLIAIALALNVSPLGLLLPLRVTPTESVMVSGASGSVSLMWRWALTDFSPDDDERGLAARSLPGWLTDVAADVALPKGRTELYWGKGLGALEHVETHITDDRARASVTPKMMAYLADHTEVPEHERTNG